jgi:hypothetical protein
MIAAVIYNQTGPNNKHVFVNIDVEGERKIRKVVNTINLSGDK